jgi:hypothetical protein
MNLHKLARVGTILLFFPIVTFQNCSQIAPQDLQYSSAADEKVSGAGVTDPMGGSQGDGDVVVPGDTQTPGGVTDPGNTQTPPMIPPGPVAGNDDDHHNGGGNDNNGGMGDVTDNNDSSDDSSDESEDIISDVAACMNFKADRAISGASFIDLKGRNDISSDHIDLIQGGSGKLVINAMSTSAKGVLTLLEDRHGKVVICNMEVDEISNTHGALRLINSHVKMIRDHKGSVKGYNSTVDASENVNHIRISSN